MSKNRLEQFFLEGRRPYLWIVAAGSLLYFKALFYGYTFLDDNILILQNYNFLRDMSNISQAFFQQVFPNSFLPYYRPMLTVSFMLDAQIGGLSPLVYHLTNIIIHVTASSLVFTLFTRLGYARWQSFLAGLIFTVHPVLSQGVAWIPGRNDSLLAVFTLASFLYFVDFLQKRQWRHYLLHVVFFILAIYTKETALILVVICFLYIHLIAKEKLFSFNERMFAAGWLIGIVLWCWTREAALTASREVTLFDMGSLIIIYMPAMVQFIGKIFFPFNLSVFPIIQDTSYIYGVTAVALLIAALVLTKKRRYNYIAFAVAWAVFFMLPSLIRANYRISADFIEHRVYVPIIGFMMILLETDAMKNFNIRKRSGLFFAGVIILAFSAITFRHIDNLKDRISFWENAVKTSPHSYFAHLAMASTYHDMGQDDKSAGEYKKCLELDPLEPSAFYGLGYIYLKSGMLDEAERYLKKTLAVHPFYDRAYLELGVLYYKRGQPQLAEKAWNDTLRINPENAVAYKNLAIYYQERKDFKRAAYCAKRLKDLGIQVPDEFLKSIEDLQRGQAE